MIAQRLDDQLLGVLTCPHCRQNGRLEYEPAGSQLRCPTCARAYPVVDGIPIMLAEESSEQLKGQVRFFDCHFEEYATYELENWRLSYLRRVFDALRLSSRSNMRYLDVGIGGSGYTVIEAARLGCVAYGCDLSLTGIRKATAFARSEGVAERTRFIVCSAERLPFRDAVFDATSEIAVLEHLERDDLAAAELMRVLKDGGRFFVTVPHTFLRMHFFFWLPHYVHDRRVGHLRHYTAKRLTQLFKGSCAGLQPAYSGRFYKGLQLLLPRLKLARPEWWWALERADLRNSSSPWGAQLHLSGTRQLSR